MKIIIMMLLAASNVFAIDISLVVVPGEHGLTKHTALEYFKLVQRQYQQDLGLPLTITKIRVRGEQRDYRALGNQGRRLAKWEKYFQRRRDPETLHLAILPPIYEGGKYWIAGVANGLCSYRRINPVAEVNASDTFSKYYFATGVGHELGHLLGANHDSWPPVSLMHPAVYIYVKNDLMHFSKESKQQIRRCIGGV